MKLFCQIVIFHQLLVRAISAEQAEATDIPVLQILPNGTATAELPQKADFPSSFTACSSLFFTYLVDPDFIHFLMLKVEEKPLSIFISRYYLFTGFNVQIGEVYINVPQEGKKAITAVFPLEWMTVCFSLDSITGRLRLVANGHLLLDKDYKDLVQNFWKPATIEVWLLLDQLDKGKNSGKISNVNMFSSALSLEKMKQFTEAGREECGTFGDWLSWENTDAWNRSGNATLVTVTEHQEAPCSKASKLHVYLGEFNQRMCMQHCQKIAGGRSPPVGTLDERQNYTKELNAITKDSPKLGFTWLASIVGSLVEEKLTRLKHWPDNIKPTKDVWRDYYTGDVAESFLSEGLHSQDHKNDLCMYAQNRPKSGLHRMRSSCDLTEELSCACQYRHHPPVLRLLGLCTKKI